MLPLCYHCGCPLWMIICGWKKCWCLIMTPLISIKSCGIFVPTSPLPMPSQKYSYPLVIHCLHSLSPCGGLPSNALISLSSLLQVDPALLLWYCPHSWSSPQSPHFIFVLYVVRCIFWLNRYGDLPPLFFCPYFFFLFLPLFLLFLYFLPFYISVQVYIVSGDARIAFHISPTGCCPSGFDICVAETHS